MNPTKPDFIGIGMRRCATSWLHRVLGEHPEISKPPKGLHFFNQHFDRGVDWYRKQLSDHLRPGGSGIVGEFSTTYSSPQIAEMVASRIHRCFPEAKLIASIRNPVNRCYSDYLRGLRRKEIDDISFEEAIKDDPDLVERGFYAPILGAFQRHFSGTQLHVIRYDDIVDDPAGVAEALYTFLGVDSGFRPAVLSERVGATYSPRSARLFWALGKIQRAGGHLARAIGLEGLVRFLKRNGVVEKLHYVNKDDNLDQRSSALFDRLGSLYGQDIQNTMALTGLDLSPWLQEDKSPT